MIWNAGLWGGRGRPVQSHVGEVSPGRDLVGMIESAAVAYTNCAAIKFVAPRGPPLVLTWGELWARVASRAGQIADSGIRPGDRVMLVLSNDAEFVEAFFGSVLAGAIPVPVSPLSSLKGPKLEAEIVQLRNVAKDSGAAAVLSTRTLLMVLRGSLHQVNPNMRFVVLDEAFPPADPARFGRPSPEDVAFLQYTSGSTSRPKGVQVLHRSVIANNQAVGELIVRPHSVCVSWLPLFHDMGLIGTLMNAFYTRTPVVVMRPTDFIKDPAMWLRVISENGGTITCAPNFAFNFCVKNIRIEAVSDVRLDSLDVALNGAEPVDPDGVRAFEEKFAILGLRPGVVKPVYGLAEATLAVSFHEPGPFVIDRVDADRLEVEGVARPAEGGARVREIISVGQPIPEHRVRIVGPEGDELSERIVGEIVVAGPSVTAGYFGNEDATREAFVDGWLHTGDRGYIVDDRLYVVGRIKDMLIRNGRNYYPQDIEYHASRISGVRKGGVAALCVEVGTANHVVLVVETRHIEAAEQALMESGIQARLHDAFRFGADRIFFVPPGTIPKTTSGKVRRQLCKQKLQQGTLFEESKAGYAVLLKGIARSWWAAVQHRG